MKHRITNKNEFHDLAKHIKENKSYNVTIQEAKVRNDGFTEKQLEQLGKILAEALAPINKRLDRLEDFAVKQLAFNEEQRKFNELLLSLPTIKKELKELKKNKK